MCLDKERLIVSGYHSLFFFLSNHNHLRVDVCYWSPAYLGDRCVPVPRRIGGRHVDLNVDVMVVDGEVEACRDRGAVAGMRPKLWLDTQVVGWRQILSVRQCGVLGPHT